MPGASRFATLREILHYVPQFRGRTFVIALHGQIVDSAGLVNLLRDIALLHNLNIRPILLADFSQDLRRLAGRLGDQPDQLRLPGPITPEQMELLVAASGLTLHRLVAGLQNLDVPCVYVPAIVAHPVGILRGVDWGLAGKVDRIDVALLEPLVREQLVPIVLPIGTDGDGQTYCVPFAHAAAALAAAVQAVKLLYVTPLDGLIVQGQLIRQLPLPEAERLHLSGQLQDEVATLLEQACEACRRGVDRVHIINGLREQGLLAEVFSSEGVGTLIHRDEYAAIRPATPKDLDLIYRLLLPAMEREEVLPRSVEELRRSIDRFLVYDVDGNVAGCVALYTYPDSKQAEIACLAVDPAHENQGIGRKLVERAMAVAAEQGAQEVFVLSTQTYNYFRHKLGFVDADPAVLPAERRRLLEESARNSRVLRRPLVDSPAGQVSVGSDRAGA